MVRSEGVCSNDFETGSQVDFEELFQELERWQDILKDDTEILRGPKP